ncbi:hypothetical protein K2173_014072 [Erythroxylum novogranatense]|uniref:RING-type E3 ubiquitin transferase n=1 Tax=Erythroxylum novogranatense TaxID=1862640 RepID=A0AAV8SD55_9ROSI|nr:hypothetical protein K2173_014072 [Erythroxylum novogranatense]
MKPYGRKILVIPDDAPFQSVSPTTSANYTTASTNSSSPSLHHQLYNTSLQPPPSLPPEQQQRQQRYNQYSNAVHFDSSMAFIVFVLFTALSIVGFLSIYIRTFTTDEQTDRLSSQRHHRPTNPPCKGLDPEIVKSLPVYSYHHVEVKYQMECAICLGEFEEKESVKMIPSCEHIFHSDCIDTWLKLHVTCPVCRGTQFSDGGANGGSGGGGGGDVVWSTVDGRSTVEDGQMSIEIRQVGTLVGR